MKGGRSVHHVRSAGQDAVCAGCAVVGDVCVGDMSAARGGAEADALAGMP